MPVNYIDNWHFTWNFPKQNENSRLLGKQCYQIMWRHDGYQNNKGKFMWIGISHEISPITEICCSFIVGGEISCEMAFNIKFPQDVLVQNINYSKVTKRLNTSIKDASVQKIQILASLAGVGRTGWQVHSWKRANVSIL